MPTRGRDSAAAVTLATPGRELELVLDTTKYRVIAVLIPAKIPIGQIEIAYALGNGVLNDNADLAHQWNCWAVLADRQWARSQLANFKPRPTGAKILFLS